MGEGEEQVIAAHCQEMMGTTRLTSVPPIGMVTQAPVTAVTASRAKLQGTGQQQAEAATVRS